MLAAAVHRFKPPTANLESSMEARSKSAALPTVVLALFVVWSLTLDVEAARYQTTNFDVVAPTGELAQEIGNAAEHWRKTLAVQWIGKEMPPWSRKCPIKAEVAPHLGAGGVTTFVFDRGEVFDWNMTITGSRERVLDSVLPHEITHTIFACHFRQPLPRWADEGACTTVEHPSEIAKQERLLIQFLQTGKGIPFGQMFAMKEYPRDVLPLYAQGHSLTRYLIGKHGQPEFLKFVADGMTDENWPRAVREHYGHQSLLALQNEWLEWVKQGRPVLPGEHRGSDVQLAGHEAPVSLPPRKEITPLASTNHESAYSRNVRQQGSKAMRADTNSANTVWR
ncbi:hypothetical protein [Aeoliella mucimassa]|uniref:Peptidase MA-like domain-containing protein n=1 Tax=Aeoliella mucimassa TaxID=2527972 RepID=A0A518ANZ7_9BACT|nr:hypothetical protein [Aeoliella mucimassa]QDU56442.1 hypothetical protein Pan181_26510 [Aeoliella mucimassa]